MFWAIFGKNFQMAVAEVVLSGSSFPLVFMSLFGSLQYCLY
jgi:hypothetical protein